MNTHTFTVEGYPDNFNQRDFAQMVLLSIPKWIHSKNTIIILRVDLRVHDGNQHPQSLFADEDCYSSVDGRNNPYFVVTIVYQLGLVFTKCLADKMAKEASIGIDKIIEEAPWFLADVS
ncbi:MAG: hypothetical protein WAW33_02815 [Minisyncoccia bacterium]